MGTERKGFDFTNDQLARLWERAKQNGALRGRQWADGPEWRSEYATMLYVLREFNAMTEREPFSEVDLHFYSQAQRHRPL